MERSCLPEPVLFRYGLCLHRRFGLWVCDGFGKKEGRGGAGGAVVCRVRIGDLQEYKELSIRNLLQSASRPRGFVWSRFLNRSRVSSKQILLSEGFSWTLSS